MFYSQDILQKRGGKFGIVWIAATKASHLTKRDYSSVNVRRTCEDLVDYICVRVQPADYHTSRPRFSLYLSAQLMYGVIKVYAKQHDYLSHEVTTFSQRVFTYSMQSTAAIDLPVKLRHELLHDLPELCEFDPTFELFKTTFDEPEMYVDDDMQYWRLNGSPGQYPSIQLPESSPSPTLIPFRSEIGSPHTVPNQAITLVEHDRQLLPEGIPGDLDIPPPDDLTLQNILEGDQGMDGLIEGLETTTHMSPVAQILHETPRVPSALLEEPPVLQRHRASPGVTPPQNSPVQRPRPADVTFELSPLMPSPTKKRALRKRQLLFADEETTLSKSTIRNNLATAGDLCMDLVDVIPVVKARKLQDFFLQPTRKAMGNHQLLPLWLRNCKTKRQAQEGENELWTVAHPSDIEEELLQVAEAVNVPQVEQSAVSEQLRQDTSLEQSMKDLSRSSRILSPAHKSDVMLTEGSARKRSRLSRASSSEDELSIPEHMDTVPLTFIDTNLDIVVEEPAQEEVISPGLKGSPEVNKQGSADQHKMLTLKHDEVLRLIASLTTVQPETTFAQICPTSYRRSVVASMFMSVLELGKQRIVFLRQRRFHGEIIISRGTSW